MILTKHRSIRAPHRSRLTVGAVTATLASATLLLAACSTSSPTLDDTSWGEPDTKGKPSLTLQKDGRVSGSDGCNRLMGKWQLDGDTVKLGPLASTKMFCQGVDTWLERSATAVVKGDTMTLSDESGAEIGSLKKTKFTPLS